MRAERGAATRRRPDTKAIILFGVGTHRMAIWAQDVKEIRSDPGLTAAEVGCQCILYANTLFDVEPGRDARLILLRGGDVGFGVDYVERMVETTAPRPLPQAFRGPERDWYLGLVSADESLIPLVNVETLEREAIRQTVETFV